MEILADSTTESSRSKRKAQDSLNRKSKQRKIIENNVENYDFELEETMLQLETENKILRESFITEEF